MVLVLYKIHSPFALHFFYLLLLDSKLKQSNLQVDLPSQRSNQILCDLVFQHYRRNKTHQIVI